MTADELKKQSKQAQRYEPASSPLGRRTPHPPPGPPPKRAAQRRPQYEQLTLSPTQHYVPGPIRRNNPKILTAADLLSAAAALPFYFATLSRDGACALLQHEPAGTFVLRPSSRPNCLSMSLVEVQANGRRRVNNAIVNVHGGAKGAPTTGYSFERTAKIFATLTEMVEALDGVGEPYVAAYDETAVTLR